MDLAASSIALLMNVLVLMSVHDGLSQKTDKSERTFPRIVPSKLHFFDYSHLNVTCEGFFNDMIKWRVLRSHVGGKKTTCNKHSSDFGPCHISHVYPSDSGEYWCESEDRRRSEKVQITVKAANVILESPVRPVMVGDHVTLRCIENKKQTASTKFDFYKDGVFVHTNSTGEMNLHNISVSDQGRYKCKTSENEFSEKSLLQVRAVLLECPDQPVMEGENVTLFCRDKMAASNYTSFFYKDDEIISESSTGKLTLDKVSKSNEGVYKCKTSEDRESEEQWLAVRGENSIVSVSDVSGSSPSKAFYFTALVALLLVLFVWGFIYKKYKGTVRGSGRQAEQHEQATVIYSLINEDDVNTQDQNAVDGDMYSTVNKAKKKTKPVEGDMYSTVNKAKKKTKNCGQRSDVQGELYSTVDKKKKRKNQGQTSEVLYSAVKVKKGNKPGNSSSGKMEEDTFYSLIR